MNEVPIFNPDLLSANMKALGTQLQPMLQSIGEQYIRDNQDNVTVLGLDTVKAILFTESLEVAGIQAMSEMPTPEELANNESILQSRDAAFQLVMAAQRNNSERVAALQKSAKSTALKIGALVIPLGVKALLGN